MKINEKIKEIRKKNKFTQKQFSNILNVSYSALQKYENGVLNPSNEFLFNLSKTFHIPQEELIFNDESKKFFFNIEEQKKKEYSEILLNALQLLMLLDDSNLIKKKDGRYISKLHFKSKVEIHNISEADLLRIGELTKDYFYNLLEIFMIGYATSYNIIDEKNKIFAELFNSSNETD